MPIALDVLIEHKRVGGSRLDAVNQGQYLLTLEALQDSVHRTLMVLYGGRIAEELFCDDISTGASNDIQRATSIARDMVTKYGMSDSLGPIQYSTREEHVFLGNEISRPKEFSEKTQQEIDAEVRRIVREAYDAVTELLRVRGLIYTRSNRIDEING